MIIRHANDTPSPPAKASRFTGLAMGDTVLPATDGVIINTVTDIGYAALNPAVTVGEAHG